MREILFRGRRIDNGEWVYGWYVCLNGNHHRIYTGYAETDCGDYYPDWFEVNPATVGQDTGKADRWSTKIFTGDIVQNDAIQPHGKAVVTYCERIAGYSVGENDDPLCLLNMDYTTVIGTVRDNPDLLGEATE